MVTKMSEKQSKDREHKPDRGSASFEVPLELKDRALAATAEGIAITNPSLPDNPIIYANMGFELMTGYSVESVVGRNCRFLQGNHTDPETAAVIRKAIAEQKECVVEILNYKKDGTPFWNRLSITPVRDSSGRTTHFIGVQSDVTKRRNAEDALRAAKGRLELANTKMKKDLESAALVQKALLPSQLPVVEGMSFAWQFRPCEELAGDILNIFMLDKKHVGFYILDVSGHGVVSSLSAVMLNRLLLPVPGQSVLFTPNTQRPGEYTLASPDIVAEKLNKDFQFDTRISQFFTMIYGVLDISTRIVDYVCAGHPPLIYLPHNKESVIVDSSQFPIGVVSAPQYKKESIQLHPGDRLILYTDGLIEALDFKDEPFTIERLAKQFQDMQSVPLTQAVAQTIAVVENWCSHAGIKVDLSILAIEADINYKQ